MTNTLITILVTTLITSTVWVFFILWIYDEEEEGGKYD